jgi:hypothetical protein
VEEKMMEAQKERQRHAEILEEQRKRHYEALLNVERARYRAGRNVAIGVALLALGVAAVIIWRTSTLQINQPNKESQTNTEGVGQPSLPARADAALPVRDTPVVPSGSGDSRPQPSTTKEGEEKKVDIGPAPATP